MPITTVLLYKETPDDTLQFEKIAEIRKHYLEPLEQEGITQGSVLLLPLIYNTPTKIIAKTAKAYLTKLKNKIPDTVTNLVIADGNYFKFITRTSKLSNNYGTIVKGAIAKYTNYDCVYVPNYKSLFKQPENASLITLGIKAIAGKASSIVLNSEEYGFTHGSDREILYHLYKHKSLTVDIETTEGMK